MVPMSKVFVLGTGGTIASKRDDESGSFTASTSAEDLLVEPVEGVDLEYRDVVVDGSYRFGFRELRLIAEAIAEADRQGADGVVVPHGTDTVEETAFLANLVHASDMPVVFTGAQRAGDQPDSDGPRNLTDAIRAAASPRLRGVGVALAFGGELFAARGLRKAATLHPTPFEGERIAVLNGEEWTPLAAPARREPVAVPGERIDGLRIGLFVAAPSTDPGMLIRELDHGLDGVVLAGTGAGNAGPGYADAVAEAVSRGVPVVLASRTMGGPIAGIYGNGGGADLLKAGAISAGLLSPLQARILLAALIANDAPAGSLAGEFAARA